MDIISNRVEATTSYYLKFFSNVFNFLNYESMIIHLQETWKLQNKTQEHLELKNQLLNNSKLKDKFVKKILKILRTE